MVFSAVVDGSFWWLNVAWWLTVDKLVNDDVVMGMTNAGSAGDVRPGDAAGSDGE